MNALVKPLNLAITQGLVLELQEFLNSNRAIWEKEIIQNYPDYSESFGEDYIDSLVPLSDEEVYRLGHETYFSPVSGYLPKNLEKYNEIIKQIKTIFVNYNDSLSQALELPPQAFQNFKGKKRHEFIQVTSLLSKLNLLPSELKVIDFCGGAGYFSRNLAYYFNTEAISVDIDGNLQNRGKERNIKYIPKNARNFDIRTVDVLSSPLEIKEVIPQASPFIGIHACAHLLDEMLSQASDGLAPWIIGIGCCYYKTEDSHYALSNFGKQHAFYTTVESLVSASRGHDVSFDNFKFSLKVKRHRYLLHIFLKDYLGYDFVPTGNCPKSIYDEDFTTYATNRLTNMFNEEFASSHYKTLNMLAQEEKALKKVERMLRCNFIRVHFGKMIEYLITLDRALFLLENNYQVSINEIFDPKISPRNLAIIGLKNTL